MVLKPVGDRTGARTMINLKSVGDTVIVKNVVKFPGVGFERVVVADIDGDGAILAQVVDVSIESLH